MIPVQWREAEEDRDAKALADFVCGLPIAPSSKPPSWEKSVQRFFQTEVWGVLRQLEGADPHLRIAEDDRGIAAAYTHNRLESHLPEYAPPPGWENRLIGYLGIATRYRRQGGAFADQVLTDALYAVIDVESDCEHGVIAWGKVHRKNTASKNMLTRNGFRYRVSVPDDGTLEHWSLRTPR